MGTFSSNLLLSLLAFGESAANGFDNWGESANFNFSRIDSKLGDKASLSLASGDITLSAANEAKLFLEFTGTIASARTVNISARSGLWIIANQTAGEYTVSIEPSGGTATVVPKGISIIYSDGNVPVVVSSSSGGGGGGGSEIIYEASAQAISSGSYLTVSDLPEGLRAIEIDCAINSISANPGTATLLLSIGDGTNWFEFGASTYGFLTQWTNNGTQSRAFTARLSCLDDADLPVSLISAQNSLTPNTLTTHLCRPGDLAGRPITALRIRLLPQSGSATVYYRKIRVRGLYA